jgi:hypothetical protein
MDITAFIRFTFNARFIKRWIYGGLVLWIPFVNFFSLGYLVKTSRVLMIGSVGLPTWEDRKEIWTNGMKLLFIFVQYQAIPLFLFSSGFFLTSLSSITGFFGRIIIWISVPAFIVFGFLIPFAFSVFADRGELRGALEFEKIFGAVKGVFVHYFFGYLFTLLALYVSRILLKIPYLLGFVLFVLVAYYILLVATYFFTQLFRQTGLAESEIAETRMLREGVEPEAG